MKAWVKTEPPFGNALKRVTSFMFRERKQKPGPTLKGIRARSPGVRALMDPTPCRPILDGRLPPGYRLARWGHARDASSRIEAFRDTTSLGLYESRIDAIHRCIRDYRRMAAILIRTRFERVLGLPTV